MVELEERSDADSSPAVGSAGAGIEWTIISRCFGSVFLHISMAIVVLAFAAICGMSTFVGQSESRVVKYAGLVPLCLAPLQLLLGFIAFAVTSGERAEGVPPGLADVVVSTLHQATGAMLLVSSVVLALFCRRLLVPPRDPA